MVTLLGFVGGWFSGSDGGGSDPSDPTSVASTAETTASEASTAATVETTAQAVPDTAFLIELERVDRRSFFAGDGQVDINGLAYVRSAVVSQRNNYGPVEMEWNLGRRFRVLEATIGLADHSASGLESKVELFADGRQIFNQTMRVGHAAPVRFDVTGVLHLKFVATSIQSEDVSGEAALGDARLS